MFHKSLSCDPCSSIIPDYRQSGLWKRLGPQDSPTRQNPGWELKLLPINLPRWESQSVPDTLVCRSQPHLLQPAGVWGHSHACRLALFSGRYLLTPFLFLQKLGCSTRWNLQDYAVQRFLKHLYLAVECRLPTKLHTKVQYLKQLMQEVSGLKWKEMVSTCPITHTHTQNLSLSLSPWGISKEFLGLEAEKFENPLWSSFLILHMR